jgi:hypothetical protein
MVKLIKVTVPKTDVAKAAALMAVGYRLNSVIEARGRVPEKHIYIKEVTEAPTKKQLDDFTAMFDRLGLEPKDVAFVKVAGPAAPAAVAAVAAPAFFAPVQGNGNLFKANANNPYAMNVDDGGGGASARKGRKQRKTRRRRNGGKSRRGRTYNRRS